MKLFGEYLVEKSLIKEDQLLEALITQLEEISSVAKVVYELSILSQEEILKVLRVQVGTEYSFIESAKSLLIWSKDKTEKLYTELSKKRTPLGQILVQKKYLDLMTLTKALDDFFGEKNSE